MVRRALLIGVDAYQHGLDPLSTTVKNVERLAQVLKNSEIGGYEVTALLNPTARKMGIEIEQLFVRCSKSDLALFFFSGHGIKNDAGDLFFATCDTQLNSDGTLKEATAIAASSVRQWMNNSRCKHQVVILDCCFSGAFSPNVIAMDDGKVDIRNQLDAKDIVKLTSQSPAPGNSAQNLLGLEGRAVLTSSDSTKYSFEQKDSDLSIYTRNLVEGLETGVADSDEDGYISAHGLHEYAKKRVQEEAPAMSPKFFAHKEGHGILLARSQPEEPESVYRRTVTINAKEGEIPDTIRPLLEALRKELELTPGRATEIEKEVLEPSRELQRKKLVYKQQFTQLLVSEKQFPLSKTTSGVLKELEKSLRLRKEDVEQIQKSEVLNLCKTKLVEVMRQGSRHRTTV